MKKNMVVLIVFSMLFLNSCASTDSKKVNTSKKPEKTTLTSYVASDAFKRRLSETGVLWDKQIGFQWKNCNPENIVTPISFGPLEPVTYDGTTEHPTGGRWLVRYLFSRCGSKIVYNVMAVSQKDGNAPKLVRLVPGTTNCSPTLMYDVRSKGIPAMTVIQGGNKDCTEIDVITTKVTAGPAVLLEEGKKYNGVWEEEWLVTFCENAAPIKFCFVPKESDGTTWIGGPCKWGK